MSQNRKKLSLFLAFLPILVVIFMGLMSAMKWKAGMHTPLLASIIVAAIIGKYLGYSWSEMEKRTSWKV